MSGHPVMSQAVIRRARQTDLEEVVGVFLACWTISYEPLLPAAALAGMDPGSATALWRAALAETPTFLAEDGCAVGVARCTPLAGGSGRVDSLYVHPRAQGTGLGGRLLATCTDHLRAAGASRATLWVFAPNEPARAFYSRHGWRPTGEQRVEPEYGVPELELERVLA